MYRDQLSGSILEGQISNPLLASGSGENVNQVDQFVTAEPTPKDESRRGWRRRRVRRGKS
ncbi:MAG: hypothetical protein AAGL90_00790 [Pseudomonadota bacterium]